MSETSVRTALRSSAPLVVIEAPAGCGKTYQGADYARQVAESTKDRVLILTHTHAACSVFAERTREASSRVEIRTIDSLISQVATAYHLGMGLPADTAAWARQTDNGYAQLAAKTAALLDRHPMLAAALARRFPTIICDEHQDCSGDQHAVCMTLHSQGAKLRMFGDPMQRIYRDPAIPGSNQPLEWRSLADIADASEELDIPHRWSDGCPELGAWALRARSELKAGGQLDLSTNVPRSVEVLIAENQSPRFGGYQLAPAERRPIDRFTRDNASLLILSRHTATTQSLRAFFGRRFPLWEGHTRPALESLVEATITHAGEPEQLARAFTLFVGQTGTGFTLSTFGDRLIREAVEGCARTARGNPAKIQSLARHIVDAPDHRGVATALKQLAELRQTDAGFAGVNIDHRSEYREAVRLADYDDPREGLAHITHHRTYSRPKPPPKAISTIHKSKGLECDAVILVPCDGNTFPDNAEARCLLYVALSRAKKRLMIVVSRSSPSSLLLL